MFRDVLTQIGLSKVAERVEYQCDVMSLPVEDGSPLRWKTVKELNWGTSRVAEFVSEITEGALDVNPNEKPEDFIKDWLYHDELTYGPDCIAIGFHREQPCALMVAQINKESGWSRLSYMGLVSEFRGRGLGKWVHRHGFTMMKSQGGKLYHGGTHADNLPMRKLFETHGCRVFCEMEEWNC